MAGGHNKAGFLAYLLSMATYREHTPEREERTNSYAHVLKYTGVFGGVQGLKILMNVVRNKLASVLLGTAGMGLNAIFMNLAEVINSLTNGGLGFSSVQRISELYETGTDEEIRRFVGVVRTWSLWAALLGGLLCAGLATLLDGYFFGEGESHVPEIVLLSLFVASMPVEAGECSILKGMRQLRRMAGVEAAVALSTLFLTIPVYWLMGLRGVVLSLVLCGWAMALLHLNVTVRLFRYRVHLFSASVMRAGLPLLAKGVPYMLAAIAGSVTTTLVFESLGKVEEVVGLYKAGYGLMVTYAGMVFVAVEADYFPRLSSVNHDAARMNHTINQQVDVCVLLMAPLLMAFVMVMPWVVRLLYTSEFLPVVTMAQCAAFYMFFRAVTTPVAYTSLAKGDSIVYLIMECIYDAVFVGLLYLGYSRWGLMGAGAALSVAALFDLLMITSVYGVVYKFRLRRESLLLILPQGLLLALTLGASLSGITVVKYAVGITCLAVSLRFTWKRLSRDRHFVEFLRSKLKR